MLFSSLPFLYYFLPLVVIVYFLVPQTWRNGVLLVSSLLFYAWGEPLYVILMIGTILLFFFCGLAIGKTEDPKRKKVWLTVSVVSSLTLLGIFKYADFFLSSFNAATGLSLPLLRLALPIGISFYTFQCLSYTVDVYRGRVEAQKDPIAFGAYVALFPQLIAGPIVRYSDINRELTHRQTTGEDFAYGIRRFLVGLGKKVLIANQFGQLNEVFRDAAAPSVLFYWMYAVSFMLHIYFDFSGYSDMAIGLGRIFGFHFIENFNYPYLSRSISEFWRRWHMSLGSWFRDYVYIPMGGNRVSKGRWLLNILTVWMLTGLWHGASWNFVLWGLLFALFLLLEKWVLKLEKWPVSLRHGYVLLVVCFSFVLFNALDLGQAVSDFACLLGLGGLPLITAETSYYLRSFSLLFAVGILGATPLARDLAGRWKDKRMIRILEPIFLTALLLLCTAYLVDGSFNPFLYFRF